MSAQAETTTVVDDGREIRPLNLKELYNHLSLEMNQFKVLKTFYGDTNKSMYDQLRGLTDETQRAAIERETLVQRDEKIRSLLTPEQLVIYNQLQNPTVVNPDIDDTATNENPAGGGK